MRCCRAYFQLGLFPLLLMGLVSNVLGISAVANAKEFRWNPHGRAKVSGSGCHSLNSDTAIVEAGPEVSVIFSRLGVDLDGRDNTDLRDKKNCNIEIPFEVPEGFYLARLEQTLTYGYLKTRRTFGQILTKGNILGRPIKPIHVNLKQGQEGSNIFAQQSQTDDLSMMKARWCQNLGHKKINLNKRNRENDRIETFKINFDISGRRQSLEDSILFYLDGADYRIKLRGYLIRCPNGPRHS